MSESIPSKEESERHIEPITEADDEDKEEEEEEEDANELLISGDEEEEDPFEIEDYEETLLARPPTQAPGSDQQAEVSNTVAFQCLDELFQQGKLTGTEVAQFKERYMRLQTGLHESRDRQFHLLQKSKKYTTTLDDQYAKLAKADQFPDNITTEAGRLREQLLHSNNILMAREEKADEDAYKIETLKEEKKLLEREYQRMPKAEEIEKNKKMLEESNNEMSLEIDKYKREMRKIAESLKASNERTKELENQSDQARSQLDDLKAQMLGVNTVPLQLAKDREKLAKQLRDVEANHQKLSAECSELKLSIETMEKEKMTLSTGITECRAAIDVDQTKLIKLQAEFDSLLHDSELEKEKELNCITDKAEIDMSMRHLAMEKRNLHELRSRRMREKDKEIRSFKKASQQLQVAQDNCDVVKKILASTKSKYDCVPKSDNHYFEKRKEVILSDVQNTKRQVDHQKQLTAEQEAKVEECNQEEERLLYELSDRRIEVVELTRLAAIKADEREQKARDFMRAEMRYHRAVDDFKTKQLQIKENKKKYMEMQVKLQDFAKLYDIIKTERNKIVSAIQTTNQKASEMAEKLRILQNEIEILRSSSQAKDVYLSRLRMKQASGVMMRDTIRAELCKQRVVDSEQANKREELRLNMQRLNQVVNYNEEQMVLMRKDTDQSVQNRNDRAVQLIERNEEVYILQEKVKIQETMIRRGEIEMNKREEEINFLRRHRNKLQRQIELMKRQLPQKRNLESELSTLQIQLSFCQDRLLELEDSAQNPETNGRIRLLGGKDPTPIELQNKLESLEQRLASKEERLLEKELLYDAVSRLVDQVEKVALSGKDDTLTLAKDVNNFKSDMGHVTKRMKATTAELTMYMAQSLKLQQEVREKELLLENCYKRLEQGLPPNDNIEAEWLRIETANAKKAQEAELARIAQEDEMQYQLSNGGTTTAEPRPNAYIPDDDAELPIPRPYGGHAPFRPSEPGSNMRHVRKPKLKPIEI